MKEAAEATTMVHAQKGDKHVIGLSNLTVLLVKDDGCWYAQGLEIDYAAAGATQEEAKQNFGYGLKMTIKEHLIMHGGVDKLLQVAPQEAWTEAFQMSHSLKSYSMIQLHDLGLSDVEIKKANLPFSQIEFVESEVTAQAA
jgi:hypothetical protein